MARSARRALPDGLHHVTSRTVRGLPLFVTEGDARAFLSLIDCVTREYAAWRMLAYCLMPNHVHFVVDAKIAELSVAMHRVNGLYAQRFNRTHGCRGHLFQGRFHAKPILDGGHLPESVRYVLLNPVRAGLCTRPEHWRWSSYRASIGLTPSPHFLSGDQLASALGTSPADVERVLREFVDAALPARQQPATVPGTVPADPARATAYPRP
ncbi:MAG TPA: transposase [Gaiellaceae bacterium]|nr:transposase [Gaiellaceae bacterium]